MNDRESPPSTPPEPAEQWRRPARVWLGVTAVVLVAAAILGAVVAPRTWQAGAGEVRLTYQDRVILDAGVDVGGDRPYTFEEELADGRRLVLALPDGVPVDQALRAEITVQREGTPEVVAAGDIELRLIVAGAAELVPVLRVEEQGTRIVAGRRPPRHAPVVLALLGAVVVLWVSELLPLFVTSLAIPVVLAVANVTAAQDALAPFFHPIIALFFGGFLMAEAMRRAKLDHYIAINFVARLGRSPFALFAAMLAASAFLSMWMSNTAATAVLIPIALAVTGPFAGGGYQRAMVLGIAYAATIGGVGSAIGTPANPLAITFLSDFADRDTSFVDWFPIGLPLVVLFLPIMSIYLWWRMHARVDPQRFRETRNAALAELREAGGPSFDQIVVLAVFAGVVVAWLTQTWHDVDTGIIAVAGAVALFALRRLEPADLGRISWPSLLTFGGGLALGLALVDSGAADWLATRFDGLAGLDTFLAVAIVAGLALALTTVASNTAAAAMLIPLAIPLASVLGLDPVLLVLTIAVASSVDFALVIGTPPTMLAYATRLFTAPEILRIGFVLDLLGIVLLVTAVRGVWEVLGVV